MKSGGKGLTKEQQSHQCGHCSEKQLKHMDSYSSRAKQSHRHTKVYTNKSRRSSKICGAKACQSVSQLRTQKFRPGHIVLSFSVLPKPDFGIQFSMTSPFRPPIAILPLHGRKLTRMWQQWSNLSISQPSPWPARDLPWASGHSRIDADERRPWMGSPPLTGHMIRGIRVTKLIIAALRLYLFVSALTGHPKATSTKPPLTPRSVHSGLETKAGSRHQNAKAQLPPQTRIL